MTPATTMTPATIATLLGDVPQATGEALYAAFVTFCHTETYATWQEAWLAFMADQPTAILQAAYTRVQGWVPWTPRPAPVVHPRAHAGFTVVW